MIAPPQLAVGWSAYRRLLGVALVVGLTVTVAIAYYGGLGLGHLGLWATSLAPLLRIETVVLVGGATLVNLGLRFLRWQYLLRRSGIRCPTRDSLLIYIASLGLLFVPLCAGEIALKGYLIGGGDRARARAGWTVALYERVCDVVALCALAALLGFSAHRGGLVMRFWWVFLVPPVAFATVAGRRMVAGMARLSVMVVDRALRGATVGDAPDFAAQLVSGPRTLVSVGLGVLAWGVVCGVALIVTRQSLSGAAGAVGVIGWQVAPLFAAATVLGGLSLSPGGAGVTGLVFGYELIRLGAESRAAFAVVVAVRVLTFWFSLGLGHLALALLAVRKPREEAHFDSMSEVYDAQLPPHIRDLVVGRKIERMMAVLPPLPGLRGLDIGCGLGWYLTAFGQRGAAVVGFDYSLAQARAAQHTGAAVAHASATALPYRSGTFDFAYAVNIVHHLDDRAGQEQALAEAARVLKPGGVFFLHEINVINPLFRFYMSYVFPLIKRIDEGTELWLDPDDLPVGDSLRVETVSYFTFVPDFVPHQVLQWMLPLERRLERSRWAPYSAHFMATLRKT
ncbi:MAG: methyltransferase domain-containing protein [Deltaproteobacteria bacterium]|nr:methyltransferase domain-containing protein [Deltaproteobacteria bacterium]MBI3391475.1 methyltransferase domain-containing protein [Deltaproteobacteria bacterium]